MEKNILLKTACNNDCIFCRDIKRKYHKHWNAYDRIGILNSEIVSAVKKGCTAIKFTGSEPLDYPYILQLTEYAHQHNIRNISIATTGRRLKDPIFLKKLIKAGINLVKLPIYGSDRKYHDSVTRAPGSFEDLIRALDNLSKLKVDTYLTCLVLRSNYKNISDLTRFIVEKYPSMYFGFIQVKPFSGSLIEYKKAVPSYSQVLKSLKKALELYKEKRSDSFRGTDYFYDQILSFPPCIIFKINKDLLLLPSASRVINREKYKIFDESFPYAYRSQISACKKCKYEKSCSGIYKLYLKAYGAVEFKPVS